jgi:putative transposase
LKKSRFSDEQIAKALRQSEAGTPVAEITRKLGLSEATFYAWKKKFGSMGTAEIRELRQLREDNLKLKRLVADLSLDKTAVMVADLAPLTHEFRQIPDDGSNRRFDRALSLGHMRCNRLGLSQEMEMRARAHAWSSGYSLAAREAANTERRGDQ